MVLLWNASKLQPTEATLSKQILVFLVYVSNKGVSIYIEAPFLCKKHVCLCIIIHTIIFSCIKLLTFCIIECIITDIVNY